MESQLDTTEGLTLTNPILLGSWPTGRKALPFVNLARGPAFPVPLGPHPAPLTPAGTVAADTRPGATLPRPEQLRVGRLPAAFPGSPGEPGRITQQSDGKARSGQAGELQPGTGH